jgi:hypothetical protein
MGEKKEKKGRGKAEGKKKKLTGKNFNGVRSKSFAKIKLKASEEFLALYAGTAIFLSPRFVQIRHLLSPEVDSMEIIMFPNFP